ncbi:Ubiquinone biosynthesis O-methyltransferase [bacterium HR18]|uniref:Class I SAM-dependent methyltransferase n=1 Tax=Rhodothermus marinus TaxID=29549 RepID=A0A7V2B242_RHOMR|nr:Ubiquinone biosynthesis O-methyltransferase [bacterium HR18]
MSETMDQAKAEAFAGRMMALLNDAFLGMLVSIGHQTRLFDTMAEMPPATSEAIAQATRLQERYVREWLGGMVVARIVSYDPATQTYVLPPEHAAFLTRSAGANNLAFFTQYIRLLSAVEGDVIRAFREGSGVGYDKYPDFQRLQAEESAALFDTALVEAILPLADGVVERLRSGIDVIDLGTGQGHAVNVMARAFPNSRFVGVDFSAEGIEAARAEAASWKLPNARFEVADVAAGLPGEFDFVTAFDVIHDLAKPKVVLANISRALRPEGVFLMMDMAASSRLEENLDHPFGPALYGVSVMHCMTVSLAQGGEGLGTMWGEQMAQDYLKEAGFSHVQVHHLEGDPMHAIYVARS